MTEGKQELRSRITVQRDSLSTEVRKNTSELICARAEQLFFVPEMVKWGRAGRKPAVFTYLPFRSEVNLMPLIHWLWKQDAEIIAPRTAPKSKSLELMRITGPEDLGRGTWGIPEPLPGCMPWTESDALSCVILPGLAFDHKGGRLGYGGGYYDRFLERLQEGGQRPVRLALAYELQIVDNVPMEPHDFTADIIVTEKRTIKILA